MTQRPSTFPFTGGLDQVSAALAAPPGRLIAGLNYEPLAEGYGRVDGFERTDGRLASETVYHTVPFENGGVPIEEGDGVEGATSGATATVLLNPVDFEGSWDDNDAAGTLVLVGITGAFTDGEEIEVGGIVSAEAAGPSVSGGAPDTDTDDEWTEAAHTWMREQITAVPGSGAVRGVAHYSGNLYAVRDNAGATAAVMHRASAAGWVALSFGRRIAFTAGLVEIVEGQTVNGLTSGATAVVQRVVRQTGDWGTTAAGYLVLSGQVSSFVGETLRVGTTNVATIGGNSTAITLPPGGRYMFKVKNFYGAANKKRLYGVNGVGYGFEFDGTVLAPIITGGMEAAGHADTPERLFEIANHLGFVYPGGSVQISATGEPMSFLVELGALELGLGDDCTDVRDANDSAVIFYCAEKIAVLTGRDSDSFQLEELTEEAGAEPWTVQRIGKTVYLDKRGLRDVTATSAFGNFKYGALSELFEPYLKAKRRSGARPVLALRSKTKGHYRLFWDDATGFSVFMGHKNPEMIPFELDGMQPSCGISAELADGTEGLFVGAENGFVYKLDSGCNFDGEAIRGFVMPPFNHVGSPRANKRYHGVDIEMIATPRTRIGITAQFDYGSTEQPIDGSQDFTVSGSGNDFIVQGGGGSWDLSVWNTFFWSSPYEGTAQADIDGFGRNIGLIFAARSAVLEPAHVLQAYSIIWSEAGIVRRIV